LGRPSVFRFIKKEAAFVITLSPHTFSRGEEEVSPLPVGERNKVRGLIGIKNSKSKKQNYGLKFKI